VENKQIDEAYNIIEECGKNMAERLGLNHWNPPDITPEIMCEYAREKRVYGVKIENKEKIIATFIVEQIPQYDKNHIGNSILYFSKLAVLCEYQGQGIGTYCVKEIEKLARQNNCKAVRCDALMEHKRLIKTYHCNLNYDIVDIITKISKRQKNQEWKLVLFEKVLIE
jgi:ribosomal protein S18 acetylase RimI-like enzyme